MEGEEATTHETMTYLRIPRKFLGKEAAEPRGAKDAAGSHEERDAKTLEAPLSSDAAICAALWRYCICCDRPLGQVIECLSPLLLYLAMLCIYLITSRRSPNV